MYTPWIILGTAIILVLASYAAYLLFKLKKQREKIAKAKAEKQAEANAKREAILDDIRYIAKAMVDDRCELSEGVVRIARLFELLSLSERVAPDYPQLFTHFAVIKDHPIMDARKALPKQERMKLDLQRMKSEAEHEQAILAEARLLAQFSLKPAH
ncbi:MAG: DUF2489 domain-containing protein [Shewanella sp.]|nr:DUF2489 domain-containing protein [Shewanella sp.]MCF1430866.1 DUF2489 domain-containing protein [Shewanella sp.]MCF1438192.1 DUF2489 domain-containing protein [Shewanella sp.]MCF1457497.1 DUF2489 domain-containing protein [Shewanella sp.]